MVKCVGQAELIVKKAICNRCFSELEYTCKDVYSSTRKDYTGFSDRYYYITCPSSECAGKDVYIDVPQWSGEKFK